MNRRRDLLERLTKYIADYNLSGCTETCFRILYGLPANLQIELSQSIIQTYLPFFKREWPNVTWPDQLLNDPDQWLNKRGRSIPADPVFDDPADLAFKFSFDALLIAVKYQSYPSALTSACVCVINAIINALMTTIWIAEDLEAYKMWQQQSYFPGHNIMEKPEGLAIALHEWKNILEWLRKENIELYPDEVNDQQLEQVLLLWESNERLPLFP